MEDGKKLKRAKVFMDKIPEGWKVYSLDELLVLIRNGTSQKQNLQKIGLPVTRIETIANKKVNYEKVGFVETSKDLESYKMFSGDILFSNINSIKHIAKVALYDGEKPLYHGMNLLLLRSNSKVDSEYLYYLLDSYPVKKYYESNAKQAVNQASLNQSDVQSLTLAYPPLKEQQKIASILSSVDEAIEKTKQIIEQTETIKKRLIDQLSTNGLGHKNYKRTMIGDIPENWKISTIHEHLTDYKSGASIKSNEFVEEGVKVLPKKAINSSGSVKESNFNLSYISNEVAKQYSKSLINNEYLITVLRDLVPSGPSIGRVSKITNDEQYIMAQGVYAFKLQQTLDSNFMIHLSNSRIFRKQILAKKVGSTQVHLRREEFFNTLIPLPSLDEQIKIASIIDNFDKKITLEKDKLEYLICTKKGLMQQLLTGKVRVPTTESEEVPQ